jgi:hypothetical protein
MSVDEGTCTARPDPAVAAVRVRTATNDVNHLSDIIGFRAIYISLSFRRRERAMLRFRRMACLQNFASVHANVHNHFNSERHLIDRTTYKLRRLAALAEWQLLAS